MSPGSKNGLNVMMAWECEDMDGFGAVQLLGAVVLVDRITRETEVGVHFGVFALSLYPVCCLHLFLESLGAGTLFLGLAAFSPGAAGGRKELEL